MGKGVRRGLGAIQHNTAHGAAASQVVEGLPEIGEGVHFGDAGTDRGGCGEVQKCQPFADAHDWIVTPSLARAHPDQ